MQRNLVETPKYAYEETDGMRQEDWDEMGRHEEVTQEERTKDL
jgi:hypothetical protein